MSPNAPAARGRACVRCAGAPSRALSRGLSLVELMVGITVGLFVVAAASVTMTGQLSENRQLMLDTQLQQDLRAAADIVTRELRRIGTMQNAVSAVATPGAAAVANPFSTVTITSAGPAADIAVS